MWILFVGVVVRNGEVEKMNVFIVAVLLVAFVLVGGKL